MAASSSSSSSLLHKLLRKHLPPFRFLTSLHPFQQPPNPILTLPPPQSHLHNPSPPTQHLDTVIFPTFPFGFSPTPVFETAFRSSCGADVEEDDSGTVWADSVKKKRKRKMNKHKYQKLRKRMRRQS